MITLQVFNKRNFSVQSHVVKPTIFPDGTSQVWKLPEEFLGNQYYRIIWHFEQEREIIDLTSLIAILRNTDEYKKHFELHIPYLPYARQDKDVSNNATFNLDVFSMLINRLDLDKVTAVDVHNPEVTERWFVNFENIKVDHIIVDTINKGKFDLVVFPDAGASDRYCLSGKEVPTISCDKRRDQLTGQITELYINGDRLGGDIPKGSRILIVDDICDGGRTFVETAKAIRKYQTEVYIALFVTHGIFSKGKQLEGIDEVITTNSLLKNVGSIEV